MTLREAGVSLIDCEHRTPPASSNGAGYPYVAIPQLKEGRLDLSEARRISREHFVEWTRKANPQANDVILSRRCNPGETAVVPEGLDCALGQNLVLLRADEAKMFPPFLRWLVRGRDWWEQIGKFLNVGAVFDSLTCAEIPNFRLPIPPIDEQRVIASVLGALDDKIELNRRMNATLEAMARALFQSWFVDFDPVRAKLDGRQSTGLDPATTALFPNEFEDSELGLIPKGWRVGELCEIVTFSRNTVDPSQTPDELFAHFSLPAFDEGRTPKVERGSAIKSQKLAVPVDSVLLSKLNPHIPRIWLADLACGNRAICSTEFLVAQPKPGFSRHFLFCLLTSSQFAAEYVTLVTGTTGSHQRVKGDTVLQMKPAIPPATLVEHFSSLVKPMFEICALQIRESDTVASIRDAMLPKLLNGDVRVRSQGAVSAELARA